MYNSVKNSADAEFAGVNKQLKPTWWGNYADYRDTLNQVRTDFDSFLRQSADPEDLQAIDRVKQEDPDVYRDMMHGWKNAYVESLKQAFDDYKKDHKIETFVYENPKTSTGVGIGAAALAAGAGALALRKRLAKTKE